MLFVICECVEKLLLHFGTLRALTQELTLYFQDVEEKEWSQKHLRDAKQKESGGTDKKYSVDKYQSMLEANSSFTTRDTTPLVDEDELMTYNNQCNDYNPYKLTKLSLLLKLFQRQGHKLHKKEQKRITGKENDSVTETNSFFLCELDDIITLAETIDDIEALTLRDRYMFCMAPVPTEAATFDWSQACFHAWASDFATLKPVMLNIDPPSDYVSTSAASLLRVEQKHKVRLLDNC